MHEAESPDRQRAKSFLKQLQIAAYDAWQLSPPRYDEDEISRHSKRFFEAQFPSASEKEREDLFKRFANVTRDNWRQVPTPYEDGGWYAVVTNLSDEIAKSADEFKMTISHHPLLGTLPTGQINAMTIRVPGTDYYLIVFEWQLFLFALLLSKAVARALPVRSNDQGFSFSTERNDIIRRIDSDESVIYRFVDVLLAYAATGRPSQAQQYFAEPHYARLADVLRHSMELFVMGHEYGHIILGHLSNAPGAEKASDEAEEIHYSWTQEYVADGAGASLMMKAMQRKGYDAPLSYWGADFFFSALDIMDKAVSVLKGRDETEVKLGSHPPTKERREILRRMLPNMIGDKYANDAVQLSRLLEEVTDVLWQRSHPIVIEARNRGVQPAPWWQS